MTKIILFVCAIAVLALGAGYLMETEGGVRITVAGVEYTLGPLQSVIAAAVAVGLVWVAFKLVGLVVAVFRFIAGDETAISRWFHRNRERQGYEALAEAMMAVASGESRLAIQKAARAERYLQRPELTNLITAQAAEIAHDKKKAEETYRKLLQDERTRFVGVRGILRQKLDEGDTDTALKLAEHAFALKPRHEETQDVLLKLQAGKHDWQGARKTLAAKLQHGSMPRDLHRRRDALLALSEAEEILSEDSPIKAREAAIEANRVSPDLIPAAVMAARGYVEKGKARNATRILRKAWEAQPHPDLAAAFAEIAADETPSARRKRFETLTRIRPEDPETRMLKAELAIADEDFPGASKALGSLAEDDPTVRSVTIRAAIERGMGADDAVVRGWLAKAVNAPRGPRWVCDNCQTVNPHWHPVCESCAGFDTLSWRRPADDVPDSAASGAGMLPLIVGEIAEAAPEEAEMVEEAVEAAPEPEAGAEEAAPVEADAEEAAGKA